MSSTKTYLWLYNEIRQFYHPHFDYYVHNILQKHFQTITWTIYVHTYLLMIDQPTYLFSLWFLPPGPKYVSKSSFFLRLDVWSSNVLVNARVSTSYMASRTCTFTISIKQRKLGQAMQRSVCWGDVISRAALQLRKYYRVYHIEMDETKWLWRVEESIILLNYGA